MTHDRLEVLDQAEAYIAHAVKLLLTICSPKIAESVASQLIRDHLAYAQPISVRVLFGGANDEPTDTARPAE